ncbi:MAG: Lipopolysaccharide O-side chain biosynthesis protein (O-antigen transporter) [Parcubacteria group bacterium Gr01-1014_3]|nr:MAG: Lipopolysaccharide O-side chain biosynthesis protein (O-antigen transporter) [Parcubacteria group bacterium Gr01-1014_3]
MYLKIKHWLFNNGSVNQTIAKNTFWLFFGQMTSRVLRAAIVIYAARVLGAAGWGAFSYALGVAAFLTVFSDIGINALLTKEGSRSPELRSQYLATAFFIKLAMLTVLTTLIIALFPYLTKIPEAAAIMPILIFVFAFDALRELGSAVSRAMEKMEIEAGIQVFANFVIVVLGFIFLTLNPSSLSLSFAYAIGSGLGLVAILIALRTHFQNLFSNFKKSLIWPIFRTAWPFGLMGIMGAVMLNTDIIMLGWLRTAEEVGYYSAAQKPIQLLYVIPTLLATSIFPIIARLVKTDPESAKKLLVKYVWLAIILSVPITVLGFILAKPIILTLFGAEYSVGILTFQILLLTLPIVYPATILGNAIFAYDGQKFLALFAVTAILGNVLFNFLLIPIFGIEGAAIATILTQLITNFLIWQRIKSINGMSIL